MALSIWATPLLYELLPNPTWLIFLFVFIAVIRSLKIFDPPNKPEVVYSRNSTKSSNYSIGDVLEKCEILHEIYSPPLIWGRNGHIQTAAYGLLGHASLKRTYDKRHVIELSDNSSVLFDVFEPINTHPSGGDYTLALCPGIANTSESNYIRTCVHYAQEKGYRCAVLNHLGALPHVRLTSKRIFSYGGTEELEAMMNRLIDLYPNTRFISIGFSMGGNITTRYLASMDFQAVKKIIIGLSVGQGYCATRSSALYHDWENCRRAYNYFITENMKRLLSRNYEMAVLPHVLDGTIDEQRLWSATSIVALDESYSRRILGYSSVEEFYASCSCLPFIPNFKFPMVFLNAFDDPLIPSCLWTPIKEIASKNEYIGFILTKHGGHLGFLEGNSISPNSVTWLDRFIVQLADAAVLTYDTTAKH
ncbi:unnamed protein product [Dracunculus medinensis]|uniref:AB hydrolase-1 domain-containing protein n=1 Tax=Dracunculus medinensis TaxID=318479 RepID=A0A0N4UAJ8_DRAME|nr:unnamed protein product [Dracunculus medinensis]